MPRLTAKDFPQELLDYYDYYAHGENLRNVSSSTLRRSMRWAG